MNLSEYGAFDLETTSFPKEGGEIFPLSAAAITFIGFEFFVYKKNVIIDLFDFLFQTGIETWWGHNSSSFDLKFLYPIARSFGFHQTAMLRGDGRPIEYRVIDGKRKLIFLDTFNIVNSALSKIPSDFGLIAQKDFTKEEYDKGIENLPIERVREGNLSDCRVLLELISKLNVLSEGQLKRTAASTSFALLRKSIGKTPAFNGWRNSEGEFSRKKPDQEFYWSGGEDLYRVNERARQGYFGGRTEIYHHMPTNILQEYDINSSYPNAMLNSMPWEYEKTVFKDEAERAFFDGKEGVFRCTVNVPAMFIPPLPYRMDDKSAFYPIGSWLGSFTGLELRYAIQCGVIVSDFIVAVLYSSERPFELFVKDLYKLKKESIGALREFAKLMLNAAYGKFAQHGIVNTMLSLNSLEELWDKAKSEAQGYSFNITPMGENGLGIAKIKKGCANTHFAVAAYITSGARITMHKGLLACSNAVYGDTDSVHAEGAGTLRLSSEIGDFKHDKIDVIGEYAAPKLYKLTCVGEWRPKDGSRVICKTKGFGKEHNAEEEYEMLVRGMAVPQHRVRGWSGQLKSGDGKVMYLSEEKRWKGFSNKRKAFPDGSTRPWTVEEILRGDHLEQKSPIVRP